LRLELADAGCRVPLEPRGQGFKDASPDLEALIELALTQRLRHGDHPVLRAAMAEAVVITNPAGDVKVNKDVGNRRGMVRVDAAVALAMAIGLASRTPVKPPSVYSRRGLLSI
jgi:phage terminase large subunit-like protein